MEFAEIISAVANVGFPIICCVVLFKLQGKLNSTLTDLSATLAVMNERIDNIEEAVIRKVPSNGDSIR